MNKFIYIGLGIVAVGVILGLLFVLYAMWVTMELNTTFAVRLVLTAIILGCITGLLGLIFSGDWDD